LSAFEKHLTIQQISEQWGFSVRKVRALFRDRSDVLRIGHNATLHKKSYMSVRVPESVVTKVYAELQGKGKAR
jgi:hypothetical protein